MLRPASLRLRVTVLACVVVAGSVTLAGVGLLRLLGRDLEAAVRHDALVRATDVADSLQAGSSPTRAVPLAIPDALVQVLDSRGRVLAASPELVGQPALTALRPRPGQVLSTEITLASGGETSRLAVVALGVATPGQGSSAVQVGVSLDQLGESLATVDRLALLGLLLLVAVVATTTWVAVGRALSPVDTIRRHVDALDGRTVGAEVPVPGGAREITRLAETMNRLLRRIDLAGERQRRFISDASHELRAPLSTVRAHLELNAAERRDGDADATAVALAESIRLQDLVSDLLLLARIDEGTAGERGEVDLDDLLTVEATRLRTAGRLQVDASRVAPLRVSGDPRQLGRIVRNLVDNAERHARSRVTLSLRLHGDLVEVLVADDGAGVPTEDRERIFDRFTRLDEARTRDAGGSGLGLAIARELARLHGGEVRLRDAPGAQFELTLPRTIVVATGVAASWADRAVVRP